MKPLLAFAFIPFASAVSACPTLENAMIFQAETENAPRVYYTMDAPPISAPFTILLEICGTAPDAIEFDAMMPAHQHGMNYRPEVIDLGNGLHEVQNVVFHMPGLWKMQVSLNETLNYSADVTVK